MAIPKFLRNVFGGNDVDSEVDFDDLDRPTPSEPAAEAPSAPAAAVAAADIPAELLDAIASVINGQLPPMVAQCINPEAQRAYLAAQLGEPLAQFAESLKAKAVSELTGDRAKMQAELEDLRARRKEVTDKREEQKAALLSEQRQRRALSDRNRDLEAKIDELDSQIEQHKLTIASLMNKMRVAEVTDGDAAALRQDLAAVNAELSAKNDEIAALTTRIQQLETEAAVAASLEQRREAQGEPDEQPAAAADKPKRRRGPRRPKAPAYDPENDASADLDSVDWLLPGGVPAGHQPHVADPDFGYQPPKHTPAPDSDAQLTLF